MWLYNWFFVRRIKHWLRNHRDGIPFTLWRVFYIFRMLKLRNHSKHGLTSTPIVRESITMVAQWKPINWAVKVILARHWKLLRLQPMKSQTKSHAYKSTAPATIALNHNQFYPIAENLHWLVSQFNWFLFFLLFDRKFLLI